MEPRAAASSTKSRYRLGLIAAALLLIAASCSLGMDFLALDKQGNVWILGGYTEEYQGGAFTNVASAWVGEPVKVGVRRCVPFGGSIFATSSTSI